MPQENSFKTSPFRGKNADEIGVQDQDASKETETTMNDEAIRAKLLALQAELKSLNEISTEARSPVTLDQQSIGRLSRMDALQQQAMASAVAKRRQSDLIRIESTLTRLENGDYGFCERCGEEIPPRRLEIDPLASRCAACASKR